MFAYRIVGCQPLRLAAAMASLVLVACSDTGTSSGAGDGGAPVDQSAPGLQSSVPINGAVAVSFHRNLSLTFNEVIRLPDIGQVHLRDDQGVVYPVSLSLANGGKTLQIDPWQDLPLASTVTLTLDAVADSAGNITPEPVKLGFEVCQAALAEQQTFNPETGAALQVLRYQYNDALQLLEQRTVLAGADAIMDTGDDITTARIVREYNDDGLLVLLKWFVGAGNDGLWGSADDVLSQYVVHSYDGSGSHRRIYYISPGRDGLWMSEDDVPVEYVDESVDGSGRLLWVEAHDAPGPDGVWFNDDDLFYQQGMYEYDDEVDPKPVRLIEYNGTFEPFRYTAWAYDAQGRQLYRKFYESPGNDGQWQTTDDVLSEASYAVWSNNLLSASYRYSAVTGTYSDVLRYFHDGNHQLTGTETYGVGADQQPLTADDVATGYSRFTYDSQGLVSRSDWFDPGVDGVTATGDDRLVAYQRHVLAANGVADLLLLSAAGVDGIWLTDDDVTSSARIYVSDCPSLD